MALYKIGTAPEKSACKLIQKVWLPGMGSNHDNLKQHRIYKLQTFQWSKMPHWTRKAATRTQLVHGVDVLRFLREAWRVVGDSDSEHERNYSPKNGPSKSRDGYPSSNKAASQTVIRKNGWTLRVRGGTWYWS
jgi:hypothetical protein